MALMRLLKMPPLQRCTMRGKLRFFGDLLAKTLEHRKLVFGRISDSREFSLLKVQSTADPGFGQWRHSDLRMQRSRVMQVHHRASETFYNVKYPGSIVDARVNKVGTDL